MKVMKIGLMALITVGIIGSIVATESDVITISLINDSTKPLYVEIDSHKEGGVEIQPGLTERISLKTGQRFIEIYYITQTTMQRRWQGFKFITPLTRAIVIEGNVVSNKPLAVLVKENKS